MNHSKQHEDMIRPTQNRHNNQHYNARSNHDPNYTPAPISLPPTSMPNNYVMANNNVLRHSLMPGFPPLPYPPPFPNHVAFLHQQFQHQQLRMMNTPPVQDSYPNFNTDEDRKGVRVRSVYEENSPSPSGSERTESAQHSHPQPSSLGLTKSKFMNKPPAQTKSYKPRSVIPHQNPPPSTQKEDQVIAEGSEMTAIVNRAMTMTSIAKMNPDDLLKNFRSLECAGCQKHFGYQSRTQKELVFCAATCIADHSACLPSSALINEVEVTKPIPQMPTSSVSSSLAEGKGFRPIDRIQSPAQTGGYGSPYEANNLPFSSAMNPPSVSTKGNSLHAQSRDRAGGDRGARSGYGSERSYGERRNGGSRDKEQDVSGGNFNRNGNQGRVSSTNGPRGSYTGGSRNFGGKKQANGRNPFDEVADSDSEWLGNDVVDRKVKEPLLMETAKPMSDVTAAVASKKSSSSVTGGAGAGVDCVKPLPRKETYATQQTHPELLQTGPSSNSGAMKKPSENETPITVLPDITLSNLGNTLKWTSLELGVQLVGNRTFVNSIGDFFVQRFDMNKQAGNMIMAIQDHMLNKMPTTLASCDLNSLCLAPFEGDYYRGEITQYCEGSQVRVFYSDYGNIELVRKEELYEMPPELRKFPRLISHCRWDCMIAKEFPEEKLKEMFEDIRLPITPQFQVADGQYVVQLGQYICAGKFNVPPQTHSECQQEGASVPAQLDISTSAPIVTTLPVEVVRAQPSLPTVKPLLSKPSGSQIDGVKPAPIASVVPSVPCSSSTHPSSPGLIAPSDRPRPIRKALPPAEMSNFCSTPSRKHYMLTDLAHSSDIADNAKVFVAFSWGLERQLVVGDEHETEAPKVQGLISNLLNTLESLKGNDTPVIGEVLLAPYGEGEDYYRGVCTSVNPVDKIATLEFVDYGDVAISRFDKIRIPSDEIMQIPIMGMTVKLPPLEPILAEEPVGTISDYMNVKMQIQFLDGVVGEGADVALWINGSLTLNAVAHKTPVV